MIDITFKRVCLTKNGTEVLELYSFSGVPGIKFNNQLVQETYQPFILNSNAKHLRFATWQEMEVELEADFSTTGMLVFRVPKAGEITLTSAVEWKRVRDYERATFKDAELSIRYEFNADYDPKYLQSLLKDSTNLEEAV